MCKFVMEGDRLLSVLKKDKFSEELTKAVQNYLSPVVLCNDDTSNKLSTLKHKDKLHFGKYELFSLKLLKLCVEQFTKREKEDCQILYHIADSCVRSLKVCNGSSGKAPSLSFQKLLLHLAKSCLVASEYELGIRFCQDLYSQLRTTEQSSGKEVLNLYKHCYDLLWKAALKLEQTSCSPAESAVLCLDMRQLAFQCLLSSGEFEISFILERMVKADILFHKASTLGMSIRSSQNKLYLFHSSLEESHHLSSLVESSMPCKTFAPSLSYFLHLATLCLKSDLFKEGHAHLSQALQLCTGHCDVCKESAHDIVKVQLHCLLLWDSLTTGDNISFPEVSLSELELMSHALHTVVNSTHLPNPASLQKFIEILELVVVCLKSRRDAHNGTGTSFMPTRGFSPLKNTLMSAVECLDMFLQIQASLRSATPTLENTIRSRQLLLLSFLADVLVDLLTSDEAEDDEEIEVMRSSTHQTIPPITSPSHPKLNLARCCVPILKSSQKVMDKASKGVLPSSEHKWLGNDAYRLGQALSQCELFPEACQVLAVSCEELTQWCKEEGQQHWMDRSIESHLLERFMYLCELHRKASDYTAAMETLENAVRALPTNQLSADSCARSLVGQWVKVKKGLASDKSIGTSPIERETSVLQLFEGLKNIPNVVKATYLEIELNFYKSQSHSPHASLVYVASDLLDLYTREQSTLDRARMATELAALCRQCDSTCSHGNYGSPVSLLDEAISELEQLSHESILTHSQLSSLTHSQQHLATAYLWKAICTGETHMKICEVKTTDSPLADSNERGNPTASKTPDESKVEFSLSIDEEQAMMSDDITQCLYSSVEAWQEAWHIANRNGNGTLDIFHTPVTMLHHLHLTSLLCLSHSQPTLALKCLGVLLDVCSTFPSSPSVEIFFPYHSGLTLYSDLIISLGGGAVAKDKLGTLDGNGLQGVESHRRCFVDVQASLLGCKLALAHCHMTNAKFDLCREVLLSVLSDPLLQTNSTPTFLIAAKAKLLVSELLQHRAFELQPSNTLLDNLLKPLDQFSSEESFALSPLELSLDAVKLMWKLADHKSVKCSTDEHASRKTTTIKETPPIKDQTTLSSNGRAWQILLVLLEALKRTSKLYLAQGNAKEAHYYAREGAMLARTILLQGWYVDFLLLLGEINNIRCHVSTVGVVKSQVSRLLECRDYIDEVEKLTVCTPGIETRSLVDNTPKNDENSNPAEISCDMSGDDEQVSTDTSMSSSSASDLNESFLAEMEALNIATPVHESKRKTLKLFSHPSTCACQVCTNGLHLLQTVRLVVMASNTSCSTHSDAINDHVTSLLDILLNTKTLLKQRTDKYLSTLTAVNLPSIFLAHRSKVKNPSKKCIKNSKKSSTSTIDPQILGITLSRCQDYYVLLGNLCSTIAECYLLLQQPVQAMAVVECALSELGQDLTSQEFSQTLARLHYTKGVAVVQELELKDMSDESELWKNGQYSHESLDNDKENHVSTSDVKPVNKAKGRGSRQKRSKKDDSEETTQPMDNKSADHTHLSKLQCAAPFLNCYQLCYPSMPALLTRDTCRWLAVLFSGINTELSAHFMTLAHQHTLAHQAVYSTGKKIRNILSHDSIQAPASKSSWQHSQETVSTLTLPLSTSLHHRPLIVARNLLTPPLTPHSISYTRHLVSLLPPHTTLLTLCLAPKTHPSRQEHIILLKMQPQKSGTPRTHEVGNDVSNVRVTKSSTPCTHEVGNDISNVRVTRGKGKSSTKRTFSKQSENRKESLPNKRSKGSEFTSQAIPINQSAKISIVKLAVKQGWHFLDEFETIHHEATESVSIQDKAQWWGTRRQLDKEMKQLLSKLEMDCLGDWTQLLSPDETSASPETLVLVLGQQLHKLPWESLPVLQDRTITRMPSLPFMAAHSTMVEYSGSYQVDANSTYYVLNPHGDLLKTEKLFAKWFTNERGWEGVVGKFPDSEEFSTALQQRELYIYCGHSVGRFLASSGFHALECKATSLLIGCSSGKLTAEGKCDPTGIALRYLSSGCPALVGCLWDVTDGEIDRFCQALLKSILKEKRPTSCGGPLPKQVARSRTACKLQCLVGAAPVVYGLPVIIKY